MLDVTLSFKLIDVRRIIDVNSAEGSEAKVLRMVKRAEVTLELRGKVLNIDLSVDSAFLGLIWK
jgi:hypothetical protein